MANREIIFSEKVWVPSDKPFIFKEQLDPRTGEQSFILKGLILPFGKISRNNVLYNVGSVKEKHKQLIGRPLMYNHKLEGQELPKGHFIESTIVEAPNDEYPIAGWYYEADVDPEEADMIRKLERGDLRHISIQLVGGKVIERMGESGPYSEAFVSDIIEGSLVPAPGFLDTTAQFAEAFKGKNMSESANDIYETPRYDGDCMICPFAEGDEAKTDEELAKEIIDELGEDTVKEYLSRYF